MQTYPNNDLISYWKYLSSESVFGTGKWYLDVLTWLQTLVRLIGLILSDAGIELFFLLSFWLIMTKLSQGRDLVVSFFEPQGLYGQERVVLTFLSVISLSVSMWIIPAFLFQKRDRKNKNNPLHRSIFKEHLFFIHRVLPLFPFWILAFIVFNGKYTNYFFIAYSITELALLFWFNHKIESVKRQRIYAAVVFFLFAIAGIFFHYLYRTTYYEAKVDFAIILYLLSILMFFIYHEVDRLILDENKKPDNPDVPAYNRYIMNSRVYTVVFLIHLISLIIIFSLPHWVSILHVAPESMLLYIFSLNVFMIDLFVYLISVTPARKFIALSVLVVIIITYATPWVSLNLKHFTMDENKDSTILKGREKLTFADRYAVLKKQIESYKGDEPYPIILVSGDGGGSRAGMWFSQNLINFDILTRGQFRDHIFSMSTVSGSSVGLSTVFAFWDKTSQTDSINIAWDTLPSKVYANNFVGSSITGLLLTDFWKTLIPGNWTVDRNSVLQKEEAYYTQKACTEIQKNVPEADEDDLEESKCLLSHDFMNLFYDTLNGALQFKPGVPLVFINTCRSNDGRRGIFSPIKLGNDVFNDAIDITSYLYDPSVCSVNGDTFCNGRTKRISFGEACNTSELFPAFSAPAYIDSLGSFVDGGYHENSGLKTTLDVYEKLRDTLRKDGLRYKIYIVYLKNGSSEKNLYKSLPSDPPLTLPLKALSSQPFQGSQSYFEERARFVDSKGKDPLVKYIEVGLDNHYITDTSRLIPKVYKSSRDSIIEKQILKDLKNDDGKDEKDSTLNFPLARWLSKSVIKRIQVNAASIIYKHTNKDLDSLLVAVSKNGR